MNSLGTHLLLELKKCRKNILDDLEFVETAMLDAASEAKATIVEHKFHEFNPFGISGMVIIAESHLSIHTWPEYDYAAVDIFTCGDIIKPQEAAEFLVERFGSLEPQIMEIKRGLISIYNEELPHKVLCEEKLVAR
ncbi:MAG: adenosylmethionine decarboxylase [Deltaproteobacteria bacterium]|jgi:S-adenosylmethionine decarboxylase|uniref:S-adenosylmethionine decarboxylase proenzyme n=1 Tax=Candidatus Acidulodesulfobacterium acidiphilum TaxID=2597224 RepID=A0A520XFU7_9DELT|nr:adenosylmethionine decarboxylase [Deltaproteobacteria bacterium]MDA8298661.1 adenosylmethionine decarboxylase [Deltaproteobacteria bacterium]RZV40073.1 MAG: adenosylmethionine decarboxylase [Candidatus Acidulodesulfobacterium acidiphilum]